MARIRRPVYLDKFKLKKMISFLSTDVINHYTKSLTNSPLNIVQAVVPLKYKVLPESYVLVEGKEIIGVITIAPSLGNPYKLFISQLFLEQNYYNAGKQLIEFVVARYGAKGASTFLATIDDSFEELLDLFINGCGFRQCASEQLWKMNHCEFNKSNSTFFRPFKNSDAQAVAMLFNDSVIPHFRHSISKTKNEYTDPLFSGLTTAYKLKYVIEDNDVKTIKAYFSMTTQDNLNYILDITSSAWYECPYEDILNFAINQISKRKKEFYLFVKVKKYSSTAEGFENFLKEKNFSCVQNQLILVKDFYKMLKEPESARKVVLLNGIIDKPVFKS